MVTREYDLIVFGANGDTGRAAARILARSAPSSLRWALAGRCAERLEAVKATALAESPGARINVIVMTDGEPLATMTARTRVLLTCAGPYATGCGEKVLLACIQSRTHYADITGEVDWVACMRRKHGALAEAAGVCAASFCGYDCVPAELSLALARKALAGRALSSADTVLLMEFDPSGDSAGPPRGTLLTTLGSLHRAVPFCLGLLELVPPAGRPAMLGSLLLGVLPRWSRHVRAFTVPHFMFWCNTPVVHASPACVDQPPAAGAPAAAPPARNGVAAAPPARNSAAAAAAAAYATAAAAYVAAAAARPTPLRFRDGMLLPFSDRWWTLRGLLPLLGVYAAIAALALPCWLLLVLPPVNRALRAALLRGYTYDGRPNLSTAFTTRATAAQAGGGGGEEEERDGAPLRVAIVDLRVPGDGGVFATSLLAVATARAMLDVLDGRAEAGAPGRRRLALPAGLCTPVAAVGGALEAQLRSTPGVCIDVRVEAPAGGGGTRAVW